MKPVQERVEAVRALIIPILKEHFVDIASEPTLNPHTGTIGSQVVWTDTAPKEVEAPNSPLPHVSEAK